MNSLAELQALTAFLGDPTRVMRTAADNAAARMQLDARTKSAAGKSPDDKTWKRRKKDGQLAMQRPAGTIEFYSDGRRIIGLAEDVFKYHLETRPPFPESLPPAWDDFLKEEHEKVFGAVLGKNWS